MPNLSRTLTLVPALAAIATLCGCEPDLPPPGGPGPGATDPVAEQAPGERPPNSGQGAAGSLLDSFVARASDEVKEGELESLALPFQAKRLVVLLMIASARGDVHGIAPLLTADASWGMPDRREPMARRIAEDPASFVHELQGVAARLKTKAAWKCPPMLPGPETAVTYGAEPMWCWYASDSPGLPDHLVFKLLVRDGEARIDYVGFFPEPVDAPVRLANYGPPPPVTPPPRLARKNPGGELRLPPGVKPITIEEPPRSGENR